MLWEIINLEKVRVYSSPTVGNWGVKYLFYWSIEQWSRHALYLLVCGSQSQIIVITDEKKVLLHQVTQMRSCCADSDSLNVRDASVSERINPERTESVVINNSWSIFAMLWYVLLDIMLGCFTMQYTFWTEAEFVCLCWCI